MRRFSSRLASLFLAAFLASSPVLANEDAAYRLTVHSLREDVAASDPRVSQARTQLARVAKTLGEEPGAIAAACTRYAGHIYDSAHVRTTSLELLDALAAHAKRGRALNDTLLDYANARKAAPGRTHAEAMAVMGGKK